MKPISRAELARCLDNSLFQAQATKADVARLCVETRQHAFFGVCVHGSRVDQAYSLLEDTQFKVTAFVGFPLGAASADVKRFETEAAIDDGAHQLEMVMNIGRLKEGDRSFVLREMRDVAEAADERPVTVCIESWLLSAEERLLACELVLDSGAQFISTSAGLSAPATVADVQALRAAIGPKFGIKATGGIRDAVTALALLEAGANRLGTTEAITLLSEIPQ